MTKYSSPLHGLNAGFAIDTRTSADAGKPLRALFLCVDFPNRPASSCPHPDPQFYYDLLAGDGLRIYRAISYGKLDLSIELFPGWIRMPKDDADYRMERVITWETHRAYIEDAMNAADGIDFDAYDILYIVPAEGSSVPYSPTMTAKEWPIRAKNGTGCGLVVTFGADMFYRRGKLFCHENGHILGLPDLYLYEVPSRIRDCFAHCGPFDLMGLIEGTAPDYLGWHKWRLGWIDDAQVLEVLPGEKAQTVLTPLGKAGGLKLLNLPLDDENGCIVEYRTAEGLDAELETDGAVFYRIRGKVPNGAGCVTLIPPEPEKYLLPDPRSSDGLIRAGMKAERYGIRVSHLGGGRILVER